MVGCGFVLWCIYIIIQDSTGVFDGAAYKSQLIVAQVFIVFVPFMSLVLIVDSLVRIRRLPAVNLVISKRNIFIHVFAFGLFSLTILLFDWQLNKNKISPNYSKKKL